MLFKVYNLLWKDFVPFQRSRTPNGEIGPAADQIYEIWGCSVFDIWVFTGKSKLCIHIKHSLLIINLHEQQAYPFVQVSDLAKNWHFCTPIIVNMSMPPPLDPKSFDIQRIFWKRSKRLWFQKSDRRLGRMWIMQKYHIYFANFSSKGYFVDNDAV